MERSQKQGQGQGNPIEVRSMDLLEANTSGKLKVGGNAMAGTGGSSTGLSA